MTIFANRFFNSGCTLYANKMCVILQCFLAIPTNIFYRKTHTKNSYKTHINCNNNNKKTRNMIYLKKIINWFSCAKKLVIEKAAAGIVKFRNLSC